MLGQFAEVPLPLAGVVAPLEPVAPDVPLDDWPLDDALVVGVVVELVAA